MTKKRRRFTADFKLKVILEALKERQTLNEIAQKHQIHQNQISVWKSAFLSQAADFMAHKTKSHDSMDSVEKEQLYAKIGQLQMELDFLKKKLS